MSAPNGGPGLRVLVTGGAGLLGRALVRELRRERAGAAALAELRVFDARADAGRVEEGVVSIPGDVRSLEQLRLAIEGVDAVLHAASLVDYGHASEADLESVNVVGTQNVIAACREQGVRALVYTSTMDVVHSGGPIRDGDETLPYPTRFNDAYARSKARAEQAVLAAGSPALRTCAIRPCGLYGEGDPYHVSNVLRLVQRGGLPVRMGDGSAVFQHVYVGNAAYGHVLALERLLAGDDAVAGQAYFLTDFPAINFFDFMEPLMRALGHDFPPRRRSVPYSLVLAAGTLAELAAAAVRPVLDWRPTLTRSSVRVVCNDLSFTGEKARRELGYAPVYSEAEAFERTVAWFREHGPVDPPAGPA